MVFVTDSWNRVQVFRKDDAFAHKWGSRGNGDDQFNNPGSVTVIGLLLFAVTGPR